MADVLITAGLVADGSGAPPKPADVLVMDGRIEAVGPPGQTGRQGVPTLDAAGLVVAPGFVDVHSHADNAPLLAEHDTSKILQGITTEVVGNCGFSLAPCSERHREMFRRFADLIFPPLDCPWSSWRELLAATDAGGYVTNYAPLVGHGTLRVAAMGMADRAPDADELALMGRELELAMEAGAFGMSTGLIYPPAVFSDTAEIAELARRLGPNGVYATHLRDESDGLLDSIQEALRIGRAGGCRVHLSHLKSSGRQNWGRMRDALDLIRHAAEDGALVSKDVYPYTAGSTMLTATLPPPWLADGPVATLARLADPANRDELARLIDRSLPGWDNMVRSCGWDGILISTTASHRNEGHTLAELAQERAEDPVDSLIHVLVTEGLRASMIVFSMREADVVSALADPDTVIGTDGLPPGLGGRPHPRQFGTFPRVLGRYVRDQAVLPLGAAVRRMTALPAEMFGIPERGRIAPGYLADLVAFAPAEVADNCDYRDPVRTPTGIRWVTQAGEVVVRGQEYLGVRRGRRLTRR